MNRLKPTVKPGKKLPPKHEWPEKQKHGPYALRLKKDRLHRTKSGPGRQGATSRRRPKV